MRTCTSTGGTPQVTTLGTTRNWERVIDSPGAVTTTDAQAPHHEAPYSPVNVDLGPKLNVRCCEPADPVVSTVSGSPSRSVAAPRPVRPASNPAGTGALSFGAHPPLRPNLFL
ncbi:hypothetical protein ABB07_38610 [Streptomyces incarnatus]|uniref:Uncharacterized protein n=1 Tax=Streptomyces incarnatus TaxID=665007 RepID=A0ABM5TX94_9ACTN|nr:hypothetical protein [Streptomyces incarnatus]AKJ15749.1 hypothetical protein ABB07_38610 [Streptomyces incarnatus]